MFNSNYFYHYWTYVQFPPSPPPHSCSVVMSSFTIVVASGLWISPGDSEEVAAALSQALRNCIERSFCLDTFTDHVV